MNENKIDYKKLYYTLFADVSRALELQENSVDVLREILSRAEERFLKMGD